AARSPALSSPHFQRWSLHDESMAVLPTTSMALPSYRSSALSTNSPARLCQRRRLDSIRRTKAEVQRLEEDTSHTYNSVARTSCIQEHHRNGVANPQDAIGRIALLPANLT